MAFEIPADLHPDLTPLAWILGRWEGSGHGDYPTIERFEFDQEAVFAHDGRPFLHWFSRAWILDDEHHRVRPGAIETGFLRPRPDGEVELVLVHPTGFAEIWYGHVDGARIEMATDMIARTSSAKEVTAGQRLYGLVDGDLMWAYDMAAQAQPLQPHLWGKLVRRSGSEAG